MGSDIDWATVERSDEPLQPQTASETDEVLSVPELTDDVLDLVDSVPLSPDETTQTQEQQRGEPGSQVECAGCGRSVRVKKDGLLGKHRCEPRPARGNRLDNIPDRRPVTPRRVREFGITVLAWGIEEGSAYILARPFGVDSTDVPTELPDAEGMIGPPLDVLWPTIPESAQKVIATIADNSDLIACALAWGDWFRTLNAWRKEQSAQQQQYMEQERRHNVTPQPAGSVAEFGTLLPFQPGA